MVSINKCSLTFIIIKECAEFFVLYYIIFSSFNFNRLKSAKIAFALPSIFSGCSHHITTKHKCIRVGVDTMTTLNTWSLVTKPHVLARARQCLTNFCRQVIILHRFGQQGASVIEKGIQFPKPCSALPLK